MKLRDANWIRRRVNKFLDYNHSSSPVIKYLMVIIDKNGDFQITSMCRFPREEDYRTFLSCNIAIYSRETAYNLSCQWASDNMSEWSSGNNYINYNNYNNYNNWQRSLGNPYNTYIDSHR